MNFLRQNWIQKILFWLSILVVLTLLRGMFFVLTNHADFRNMCFIDLRTQVGRNDNPDLRSALNHLRATEPESYRSVCEYIDVIGVKRCFAGDPRVDEQYTDVIESIDGCYINGTKTMYLNARQNSSANTDKEIAHRISRYAEMSKNFWKY